MKVSSKKVTRNSEHEKGCLIKGRGGSDYFDPPHGGRPPSDEAVRAASRRYILQAWASGHPPSPEWIAEQNPEYQTFRGAMMFCVDNNISFDQQSTFYS